MARRYGYHVGRCAPSPPPCSCPRQFRWTCWTLGPSHPMSGTPARSTHWSETIEGRARRLLEHFAAQITPLSAAIPRYRSGICFKAVQNTSPDFLPQRMKHHRGLLIADGIVFSSCFWANCMTGYALRAHIDGISHEHQPSLFASLCLVAHELVIIVIER